MFLSAPTCLRHWADGGMNRVRKRGGHRLIDGGYGTKNTATSLQIQQQGRRYSHLGQKEKRCEWGGLTNISRKMKIIYV